MSAPGKLVSRWKTGPSKGSARLVADIAWPLATVAAKRTERSHTDLKLALPGLEEDQTS